MTTRVKRALRPGLNHFSFPQQCAYCGRPVKGKLSHTIKLQDLIKVTERAGGREKTYLKYDIPLEIPYCSQHRTTARRIQAAHWAILLLGAAGIALLLIWFLGSLSLTLSLTKEQTILAGAAAILPWYTASRLFLGAIDWILSRFIPSFAATSPLQFLGVSFELAKKPRSITFGFANQDFARKFHELNGGARPSPPVPRAAPSPKEEEERVALLQAQAWWRQNPDPKDVAPGTYVCDACNRPILDKEGTSLVGSWMRCRICTERIFHSRPYHR